MDEQVLVPGHSRPLKLTKQELRELFRLCGKKEWTFEALSKRYGVSRHTIRYYVQHRAVIQKAMRGKAK